MELLGQKTKNRLKMSNENDSVFSFYWQLDIHIGTPINFNSLHVRIIFDSIYIQISKIKYVIID